ncbi:hypothetical protein TUM9812_27240 [Escherichia coli]|nr:hypothetical protein TUM9812_27240 [Escherichia coli]
MFHVLFIFGNGFCILLYVIRQRLAVALNLLRISDMLPGLSFAFRCRFRALLRLRHHFLKAFHYIRL